MSPPRGGGKVCQSARPTRRRGCPATYCPWESVADRAYQELAQRLGCWRPQALAVDRRPSGSAYEHQQASGGQARRPLGHSGWADTTCVCSPRPLPMSEEGCMRVPNIDTGRVILGFVLMLIVSVTDGSP